MMRNTLRRRRVVRDPQVSGHNKEPRILVDVTRVSRIQRVSGIPRVIVEVCGGLENLAVNRGVTVVFFGATQDGRLVKTRLVGVGMEGSESSPVRSPEIQVRPEDIFLFPDVVGSPDGPKPREVRKLRSLGAQVFFLCYDLLPITHPHFFTKFSTVVYLQWFEALLESDGALFISHATKSEFNRIVAGRSGPAPDMLRSGVISLGSSQPPAAIVKRSSVRNFVGKKDFAFLMVGTLEPRKGYSAVIDAFDRLWETGAGHTLTIVGAPGWKTDTLIFRIRRHPEFGKKLQWRADADDSVLWELYSSSDALIANSVAEGFGLPLVEAAQVGLPIIASRIDPFVEIAGENAVYIDPDAPDGVEKAVRDWCIMAAQGMHPDSRKIMPRSWSEVSEATLKILVSAPRETTEKDGLRQG